MKILFLTNNDNTESLVNWLMDQGNDVVKESEKLTNQRIREINPGLVISFNYRYLIPKEVIAYMQGHILNMHTSLLPWNRGSSPNFWSFMENTPKGVTIHLVDEHLDTGEYLFQKEVFFDEKRESFASSYDLLIETMCALFKEHWEEIRSWKLTPYRSTEEGSYHTMKDYNAYVGDFSFSWQDNVAQMKERFKAYKAGMEES